MQQLPALGVDEKTVDACVRTSRAGRDSSGVIRAPIEGTVVEKLINPGQLLEAGTTPTFTIADLSTVWVMASVFEADLASVARRRPGGHRDGHRPDAASGQVDYVAALVDPATKAIAGARGGAESRQLLKRDMYVTSTIHSGREKRGILLPVTAVLRDEDNLPFVFVRRRTDFERRQVELGSRVDDHVEIIPGLKRRVRCDLRAGCSSSSRQTPMSDPGDRPAAGARSALQAVVHQSDRRRVAAPARCSSLFLRSC